mmetsp:Transcript_15915/g.41830  ORF Transcript_15915/g.41830 Transcript_15915/m.41830 type:complete len:109 (+) Transcript_15915:487-813(+)
MSMAVERQQYRRWIQKPERRPRQQLQQQLYLQQQQQLQHQQEQQQQKQQHQQLLQQQQSNKQQLFCKHPRRQHCKYMATRSHRQPKFLFRALLEAELQVDEWRKCCNI